MVEYLIYKRKLIMGIQQSHLLKELSKLVISSQEATSNGKKLTTLENYLHVDRKIQIDLINQMKKITTNGIKKHLIFLTGSSGDGKSHLFSILDKKEPNLSNKFQKIYDATASSRPNLNSIETLIQELDSFSDENIDKSEDDNLVVLAINLGVLNNFISNVMVIKKYSKLIGFVDHSQIYGDGKITRVIESQDTGSFSIVNFTGYNDLEFKNEQNIIESDFYNKVFDRITNTNKTNPFHSAYLYDIENVNTTKSKILCSNYEMLSEPSIKSSIINLLIMARVQNKTILTTRLLFDFIYRIIVPSNINERTLRDYDISVYLPYLLFEAGGKGRLDQPLKDLDVLGFRDSEIDSIINKFYLTDSKDLIDKTKKYSFGNIFITTAKYANSSNQNRSNYCAFYIRVIWLLKELDIPDFFTDYNNYCSFLKGYYNNDKNTLITIVKLIRRAFFSWFGDRRDIVYIGSTKENMRLGYRLKIQVQNNSTTETMTDSNQGFLFDMPISFCIKKEPSKYEKIELNYHLVNLLRRIVEDNYKPSIVDEDNFLPFVIFGKQLIKKGQNEDSELLIINNSTDSKFSLTEDFDLGESFTFTKM
jgi:DNA phosphorothioation-dependent restriction protein DptF